MRRRAIFLSVALLACCLWLGAETAKTTPSWMRAKTENKVRLPDTPRGWERLDGCRLVEEKDRDGDSFYVRHSGREHRFRIYFADCPETDKRYDRYLTQAVHFAVEPETVLEYGEKAKEFTKSRLSKPFTVYTKWQDARGAGTVPRHYAVIYTAAGEDIGEALVEAGLARAYGEDADFPDRESKAKTVERLEKLEKEARRAGVGIYAEVAKGKKAERGLPPLRQRVEPATVVSKADGVEEARREAAVEPVGEKKAEAAPAVGLIDINSATKEELMTLQDIGEVYADRIIANRPYKKREDITRVDGIGKKRFEAIKDKIEAR